jgi:alcohol dehydrogenase class IV
VHYLNAEVVEMSNELFPFLKEHSFQTPRKIIFGPKVANKLGSELKMIGGENVLLITDKTVKNTDPVNKLINSLKNEGFEITIYDGIKSEPQLEDLEELAKFVTSSNSFKVVVGIGGGSVLDAAKVASMTVANPGSIKQYIGANKVKKHGLPLILIPTTAGTGSEASQAVVLTLNGVKVAIWDPNLFADLAMVDPLMTIGMPKKLTACTAIDALSHAIEAMMSLDSNPLTDAIALESVKLIGKYLRIAYANGQNFEARYHLSLAALMAGMAFSNAGLCAGHAIAYTYASEYNLPHGISCALSLPYIMAFNLPTCVDKFIAIARMMDEQIKDLPPFDAAHKAVIAVRKLIEDVALPTSLKEIGIPKGEVPRYAKDLITKYARLLPRNPREISIEDSVTIFKRMWEGKL